MTLGAGGIPERLYFQPYKLTPDNIRETIATFIPEKKYRARLKNPDGGDQIS
jgi:hypothetical protein